MLKFKTNINCSGCVEKVTPFLNEVEGFCDWDVDTTSKNKILTVHSDKNNGGEIINAVENAGFKIEIINE